MATAVTRADAIKVAQVYLATASNRLVPDGWWGSFTNDAFLASSVKTQEIVNAVLSTAGLTQTSAYADTRFAKATPGVSAEKQKARMDRMAFQGNSIENLLISKAKAAGIAGSSLVNLLANVKTESGFIPKREDFHYRPKGARESFRALAKFSDSEIQSLVAGGPAVFFEATYGPQTSVGKQLGNVNVGDGGRFFGRGLLQLTGRYNYQQFDTAYPQHNAVNNPDVLVKNIDASLDSAVFYWKTNVMRAGADSDIRSSGRIVNGGMNGMSERIAAAKAYAVKLA